MSGAVVLGIGNRLMCDDGIGVHIVEALARDNTMEAVRFSAGETDIEYCLDELADADVCIIVDAAYYGSEPCKVDVVDLADVLKRRRPARFFHDFDLIHGIKTNNMMKEGILITIEVCSVELSTELSPLIKNQFDKLAREVKEIIASYLFDCAES